MTLLVTKHIGQRAFEAFKDLIETGERRALLTILQPVEGGLGQAQLLGEGVKGGLSPFLTEKLRQILVEPALHARGRLPDPLFRMRNKWIALALGGR